MRAKKVAWVMMQDPAPDRGKLMMVRYANVVSRPRCAYCPDPQYTDEAREAKLQGKVTLRVLVAGLTGAPRKSELCKELGWGWMSARSRPFAAGNLCRRMMPRTARLQIGSPLRRSSGFSRQFFGNGVAFAQCLTTSLKTKRNLSRRLLSAAAAGPRAN